MVGRVALVHKIEVRALDPQPLIKVNSSSPVLFT